MMKILATLSQLLLLIAYLLSGLTNAARQPYDVRKIIQAFQEPHDDLVILCAHRGLR
jgi:hypothetical protein